MPRLAEEKGSYAQAGQIRIYGSFQTNASSAPTILRDGNSRIITGVSRVSAGRYRVTLDSGFPIPALPINIRANLHAASATPAVLVDAKFVDGTYNTTNRTLDIVCASGTPLPVTQTGIAVASNAATLASAGAVLQVQATAGTSAGIKTVILSGAPSAGQVRVDYTAGVPTLTFNATDAITAASVVQLVQAPLDPDTGARIDFEILGPIVTCGQDPA
jgi:hypothetical protein